jgi:hypothetical protein
MQFGRQIPRGAVETFPNNGFIRVQIDGDIA